MGISLLRVTGRLFVPVVAVALLAGVSLEAGAAGSKGQVRLQLGPSGNPSQFVYIKPGETLPAQIDKFSGSTGKEKCFFTWDRNLLPGKRLIDINAFSSGSGAVLGYGPDSIGVYNNSSGVSCYRVENRFSESITVSLGEGLASAVGVGSGGSIYFDRLELDLEVKGSAEVLLTVFLGGQETNVYFLRSGTSIVEGQGTSGESGPGSLDDRTFNCSASSDSGPDSGPNDNCRWVVNDLGDSFTLETLSGEFSLEGGGDYAPDNFANNSVIFLTSLIERGEIYCNPNNDTALDNKTGVVGGGPVASCQTTRINPNNLGQNICPASPGDKIVYDLETFVGDGSKCELRKVEGSEPLQFAGSIQITFEPEPSFFVTLPSGEKVYWGAYQSQIRFSCPDNGSGPAGLCEYDSDRKQYVTLPFNAERCEGTVVDDANGNPTILEVLSGGSFVQDQVLNNGYVDWACVLDHREVYTGAGKMQVTQTILYWGDISFSRGGSN